MSDFDSFFKLITERDARGLEPAMLYLEQPATNPREDYYQGLILYRIMWSKLDLTPIAGRLRTLFLHDLDDIQNHDRFRWLAKIIRQIASPEVRQKIDERLDHPDSHIRQRAWLALAQLNHSPERKPEENLEKLRQIKNLTELDRNRFYATAYQNLEDLLLSHLEMKVFRDRWQKLDKKQRDSAEIAEYEKDWRAFMDRFDGLPRDSLNWHGEKLIKNHKPLAIETGILFLEADPYFGSSGYAKERILDQLKYIDFTPYVSRLQEVMLRLVDTHYCREFRHYCRVAPKIDSVEFREALKTRLTNRDPNVVQRAQWFLDFLTRYSNITILP